MAPTQEIRIKPSSEPKHRDAAQRLPGLGRLTIDRRAIADNWRALGGARAGAAETGAVVKANAYGTGLGAGVAALAAAGARTFFVASMGEAETAAAALLAEPPPGAAALYVLNGVDPAWRAGLEPRLAALIRPVLNTPAEIEAWRGSGARAALQLETGMNRVGLGPGESPDAPIDGLEIDLMLSHLATSDAAAGDALGCSLREAQKRAFDAALARLRPIFPTARASLAATGGVLLGADFAYDLTRPGVGLYGGAPFTAATPVARLSAPLIRVWRVETGAHSGYGGAWRAARPSRLATAPIGYADGLPRALSNQGAARIASSTAPIAGRVSMDSVVLDVTDVDPPPEPGAIAHFLDDVLTVDVMADAAGTIGYEILTGLDGAGRLLREDL